MNIEELKIIKQLDDGSLYADPLIVEEQLRYPDMRDGQLLISRDIHGKPYGYLPVGYYYTGKNSNLLSYIASMPNSPAISPTYPPGAEFLLHRIKSYFDCDIIGDYPFARQEPTASIYCLPKERYWAFLSPSRQKDFRRKLKKAERFNIQQGNLKDIQTAWQWMQSIWEQRGDMFGSSYDRYLNTTLSWLRTLEQSHRVTLKIDKYMLGDQMVGVNCCAIHRYKNRYHCDDYLTWYNPDLASGLGIISILHNITNPKLLGYRYNLSNPGIHGNIQAGHHYKFNVIPEPLRLTQLVMQRQ